MDISNLCRSCMKEVAMWELGYDTKTMEMFKFCTNIDVSLNDLPQQFCRQCTDTIQSCCIFITSAREVDLKLKEAVALKVAIKPEFTENSHEFPELETKTDDIFDDILDNIALSKIKTEFKAEKDVKQKKRKRIKNNKKEFKSKQKKNCIFKNGTVNVDVKSEVINKSDLKCPFCGRVFAKKRRALKKHILEHLKHSKIESIQNSEENSDGQNQNSKLKEDKNPNRHYCETCNRSYAKRSTLEKHMNIFHTNGVAVKTEMCSDANFCSMCDKNFESRSDLVDHLEAAHLRYPCPLCPNTFSNPGLLYSHKMAEHRGRRFDCPHCDHTFPKRRLYTIHLKTHDNVMTLQQQRLHELRYTCDYCSKSFHFKSDLRHHLHMHDSTLKSELCDVCGSRFSYKQALLVHRRVHTGEKPFTCPTCGYACASASNMRRHIAAHRGERPHQCTVCGKAFNDSSGLKSHMNWHTGERPYKCPHCDRCYMNSSKRKNHLVRAHGLDPSLIPRLAMDGGPARRYVTNESKTKPPYTLLAHRTKNENTVASLSNT